jgi:hypothetical protein
VNRTIALVFGRKRYALIFTLAAMSAVARSNDAIPLLPDCSDVPEQPADATMVQKSDTVHVRYSLGGNSQTCYAVSAVVNGKNIEGYLMGDAHPDVAAFEREARSHIPEIPAPSAPPPVAAVPETKEQVKVPEAPKSFAGLSGTSPDGRRVSLDNISSPTVVLYFWSANNRNSIRATDGVEGIHTAYRRKGVALLGVVTGSSAASVRRVLSDEEVQVPQILDNGDIAKRYPVSSEAKYFILDRQRNVVAALKSTVEVQRALMKMRQP